MCQDVFSVLTTCFCDNREMRVHFHGINKNIGVIYRVGLNSKLGHNEALSVWTEIENLDFVPEPLGSEQTSSLTASMIWSFGCQGARVLRRAPFLKLSFLAYISQIYKLWGLRRKIKRLICFFLNWCRFPDGIRSYYWLRRNTCLCPSLVLGTANLANGSLWISKQINKAFSVFADTHYPFLLKLCQMQTPRVSFSSLCSVQNLLGKCTGEISISDSLY